MENLNLITQRLHSGNSIAVASGDENTPQGSLWASPFYSRAKQKMQDSTAGYKLQASGAIIGADYQINDQLLLGAAYSHIIAKARHQDHKNGDKTTTIVNIFSLYGQQYVNDRWFIEGVASYGIGKVKNRENRLMETNLKNQATTQQAAGKYTSKSYSAQIISGYHYSYAKDKEITPLAGIRYSKLQDGSYQETGTTYQNLQVAKSSYDKVELILGAKFTTTIEMEQLTLIPEVHTIVNYDVKTKTPKIDARLNGIEGPLASKLPKPSRAL